MANSDHTQENEEVHLDLLPGLAEAHNNNNTLNRHQATARVAPSYCEDQYHKKLAICSIICGISCIGIKALINSVKAEEARDPEIAAKFSQRAKKFGLISIVTWVAILALTPMLMALISYLLTLQD